MRIPSKIPLLVAVALGPGALAQVGPTPPTPPVARQAVQPHVNVQAEIEEGVASVVVALTLENRGRGEAEYVLAFPLPEGAVADDLKLEIDGKMQEGELADANTARNVYLSIVRKRRDPALLEYAGRGLLRLRVFPIPEGGKREVRLRYRQVLPQAGGLWSLAFPTRAFGEGRFAMDVRLKSLHGLRNVYAPTSGWDIVRKGDFEARASFESAQRPARDPELFYSLTDRDYGLSLLSYKKQGEPGYFLLLLAPKRGGDLAQELNKSVTFVVDTSGSMRGEKIQQAKGALHYFVSKLKPTDEFNIVAFATEANPWQTSLQPATDENRKGAASFVDGLQASGGTNIHDALLSALSAPAKAGHVPMLVFLTDGLASVGIQAPKEILAAVQKANDNKTRIFAFGVGNDVNTFLIDSLCEETRGTRDYVAPDENIEVKVSALFDKIAHPVLSELELACDSVKWSRMAPKRLPDLFRGEQLVVAGRYEVPGPAVLHLRGRDGQSVQNFTFEANFAQDGSGHDFVPSIWAQRRVGFLLDQMRLHGPNQELVEEIKRLAAEHGIVTPYSSQLVLEPGMQGDDFGVRPMPPGARNRSGGPSTPGPGGPTSPGPTAQGGPSHGAGPGSGPITGGGALGRGAQTPAPAQSPSESGSGAVERSKKSKELRDADRVESNDAQTQRIKDKVFVRRGEAWVDTGFEDAMFAQLRSIEAWSEEYLELLKKHPELGPYLALEGRILLVAKGIGALEIYPEGAKPTPAKGKSEDEKPAPPKKDDGKDD